MSCWCHLTGKCILPSKYKALDKSVSAAGMHIWYQLLTRCCKFLQMSKADKARMKKEKAKTFNNAGSAKGASKNAKRWN